MCFSSKTSGETKPPPYVEERMPGYLGGVDAVAQTPAPVYAGVRVAPTTPFQDTGYQMLADRALYGDPQMNAARGSLMNISQGGMANPYLDPGYTNQIIANNTQNMTDAFRQGTAAQTNAAAARAGGFGGSAHNQLGTIQAGELSRNIGDMAMRTQLGRLDQNAGLFNQDRNAMMAAAGMAPEFANQDRADIAGIIQAGGAQRDYMQQLLDQSYNTWQGEQDWPFKMMDWLGGKYAQASGGYGTNYGKQTPSLFSMLFG